MSKKSLAKPYSEALIEIIEEFREERGHEPFSMWDVAQWAIANRRWIREQGSAEKELSKHLSKAANHQHHTDPQGRRVRSLIPAKYPKPTAGGQMTFEVLWDEVATMSFEHAEIALNQSHQQALGMCQSIKNIQDTFNENNPNAADRQIQLDFNFGFALESASQEQPVEELRPSGPGKPR